MDVFAKAHIVPAPLMRFPIFLVYKVIQGKLFCVVSFTCSYEFISLNSMQKLSASTM